jgi:hypothetical protein
MKVKILMPSGETTGQRRAKLVLPREGWNWSLIATIMASHEENRKEGQISDLSCELSNMPRYGTVYALGDELLFGGTGKAVLGIAVIYFNDDTHIGMGGTRYV